MIVWNRYLTSSETSHRTPIGIRTSSAPSVRAQSRYEELGCSTLKRPRRDLGRVLSARLACLRKCRCVDRILQREHIVYQSCQQRVGSATSFPHFR